MIIQVVRTVADWLEDGTYGVNAYLASLSRDSGDAQPSNVTVVDETRDARPALGRQGEGEADPGPVLGVYAEPMEDLIQLVAQPVGDVTVQVLVRYTDRNTVTATGRADAYYTLRAVVASLRALSIKATDLQRTRNGVELIDMTSLGVAPGRWDMETIEGTAFVAATWQARDTTL